MGLVGGLWSGGVQEEESTGRRIYPLSIRCLSAFHPLSIRCLSAVHPLSIRFLSVGWWVCTWFALASIIELGSSSSCLERAKVSSWRVVGGGWMVVKGRKGWW